MISCIRADFHEPISNVQHEIIITPKMSFGTGHHATTYMMMQQMRELILQENQFLILEQAQAYLQYSLKNWEQKKLLQ